MDSVFLMWLAIHVGCSYTRFAVRANGTTAYISLSSREFGDTLWMFGERVFAKIPEKNKPSWNVAGLKACGLEQMRHHTEASRTIPIVCESISR